MHLHKSNFLNLHNSVQKQVQHLICLLGTTVQYRKITIHVDMNCNSNVYWSVVKRKTLLGDKPDPEKKPDFALNL